MKKGIHPKYETTVITCACGNKIETKSTTSITHVEICSACHPFFSGKQKLVDTAGRIERFKRKYNIKDAKKKPEEIKEEPVIEEEKPGQENQIQETAKEKIEEVKEKPETSAKKTGEIQEIPNKKITEAKAKPETEKKKPDEAKGKQETSKNKPVGVKNKKSEAAPDKTEKKPEEVKEKTK